MVNRSQRTSVEICVARAKGLAESCEGVLMRVRLGRDPCALRWEGLTAVASQGCGYVGRARSMCERAAARGECGDGASCNLDL